MALGWSNFFNRQRGGEYPQLQSNSGTLSERNPNFDIFGGVSNDIERVVSTKSVISNSVKHVQWANPTSFQEFEGLLALPVATNKTERLGQYRSIAKFPECNWCLNEICNDFIHEDENGKFITLRLPDGKDNLNETRKNVLQAEFERYMEYFHFREDGFDIVKRFLIDGELAWENVIKHDHPEIGIVGAKFLPSEYYETLVDPEINRSIGILFDAEKLGKDIHQILSNGSMTAAPIFNAMMTQSTSFTLNKSNCTPMLWPQVTYISSGMTSHDGLISYPLIEQSMTAYHQLALMQDAAVILRVTRAPERLLFNVSTGRMPQALADDYVRKFAMDLKSKKVATPDGKDIASVYNPMTMLESFVFSKSDGNDGTTVESVGSSAQYEQIEDIELFLRRFMKTLEVPFSRYKTPENVAEKNDSISYEEYAFSRLIMRCQTRFALGFKRGFITHLKLRHIWEDYGLKDSDLNISFVKPVLYDLYQTQMLMETKMNIYDSIADHDEFSKILAMKKVLGMSDAEIEQNFNNIIKEKQLIQLADFFAEKISEDNPPVDYKSQIRLKNDLKDEQVKSGKKDDKEEEESNDSDEDKEPEDEEQEEPAEKKPQAPTFGLG